MAFVVEANISLKGNAAPSKQSVEELASSLTSALRQRRQLAGKALSAAIARGEARTAAEAPSKQQADVARLPYTQALKDSFSEAKPDASEVRVGAASPKERVTAALDALGHTGYTLVYTPPSVRPTVRDYSHAYLNGLHTPADVAERLIAFLDKHNKAYSVLSAYSAAHIRRQAAAATERYAEGKPLSVFDGVPFVVKDDIDALPYETGCGTSFMGKLRPASADAPCVATLRSLGAILLGKAAMSELGLPQNAATRNPQDASKVAGGASAGCCAAVAAGLCPIAIGTEVAGGATALSASFCGVVGLKPSKGRLADAYAARGSSSSLAVTTPIANSTGDALLLYAALANTANPGAAAPEALSLPRELLPLCDRNAVNHDWVLADSKPLAGTKIGLAKQWVAESSVGVRQQLEHTAARLQQLGATIVDVSLPALEDIQASHLATYFREASADAAQEGWLEDEAKRSQLSLETRMFYCHAAKISAAQYTQAQRMRASILSGFENALAECDVILTPAAPSVAPAQQEGAASYDMGAAYALMRFTLGATLTGLPSLVTPAGRDNGAGLPIGAQLIGKPWAEATLLRAAAALEQRMLEDGYPRPVARLQLNPIESAIGAHPIAARVTKETWAVRHRW